MRQLDNFRASLQFRLLTHGTEFRPKRSFQRDLEQPAGTEHVSELIIALYLWGASAAALGLMTWLIFAP